MAAGSWVIFDRFKGKAMDGTIDLNDAANVLRCSLHTSAANLSTSAVAQSALSIFTSVTGQVANGNGYVTNGKSVTGVTWKTGTSGGVYRYGSADNSVNWSANGGNIANIKFAVLRFSAGAVTSGHLFAYSKLSTSPFTLTDTNRLTIAIGSLGIFELN